MADKLESIQATTFDQDQLQRLIAQLAKRFSATTTTSDAGGSADVPPLHDRIAHRRAHFFNLPAADPQLPEPWNNSTLTRFQTDRLRKIHNELKSRLNENHCQAQATPARDIPSLREIAERAERIMNEGILDLECRRGSTFQSSLSDAQIIDGPAILHWRLATEIWPKVPDYEWVDEVPEKSPRQYSKRRQRNSDGNLQFRETDESVQERYTVSKARAGWPWWATVVPGRQVMWIDDQSPAPNPALVVHVEIVGLMDYDEALFRDTNQHVSLNQIDSKIRIYVEETAPLNGSPSAQGWGTEVAIARVWTRDEYYELVSETQPNDGVINYEAGWTLVRSHTHPYDRVPFAICAGFEIDDPDPALRYQPALAGMYQVKPGYDQAHAFMDILALSVAVPLYFLQRIDNGQPLLNEDGGLVVLTADAAQAEKIPDGYKLVELRPEINQAYVMSVETRKQELVDAEPSTGIVEITAATKPWTARMQQSQANVGPAHMLDLQTRCIQTMVENWAHVMAKSADEGGIGEDVSLYTGNDAKERKIESVAPDEWAELDFSVVINPTSITERITMEEHGRELLADPLVPLTRERFGDDYMGWTDTSERITEADAEEIYGRFFKPQIERFVVAQWAGSQFAMGPNGEDIGINQLPVSPEQIGAANGITPMPQPMARPQMPQIGQRPGMPAPGAPGAPRAPQAPVAQGTVMPGMPGIAAPGTDRLQGVPG